ncbi:MAG: serine/threonine-protein kinase, partial [Planctomycetota bacterium]
MLDENALFAEIARKLGYVTPDQLREALGELERKKSEGGGSSLGQLLMEKGIVSRVQLKEILDALKRKTDEIEALGGASPTRKEGERASLVSVLSLIEQEHGVFSDVDLMAGDREEEGEGPKGVSTKMRLLSGGVAEERYVTGEEIARGGMGAIHRAVDRDLRREVAMKILLGGAKLDRGDLARFIGEVQVTAQLEHPNIVPVHELGVDAEGKIFFTMKLIRGRSLFEIIQDLRRPRRRTGTFTVSRLLNIFLKVCDAIAFAHARGVIHRDLKPENVMVGEFGEVLVMDWGLSKVVGREDKERDNLVVTDREEDGVLKTLSGRILGTPSYMPPEQAKGNVEALDERSDIYALGAILYEILTYEMPYPGETQLAILAKVLKGRLIPPTARAPRRKIAPELEAVVLKCMAGNKADRYAQVEDLRQDIEAHLEGRTLAAVQYNPVQLAAKWVKRNKVLSGAAAAVVVALVLGAVGMSLKARADKASDIKALLLSANQKRNDRNFMGAQADYFKVLGLDPTHPTVRDDLGKVSLEAEKERGRRKAKKLLAKAKKRFKAATRGEGEEGGSFEDAYKGFLAAYALDPTLNAAEEGIARTGVKVDLEKRRKEVDAHLKRGETFTKKQRRSLEEVKNLSREVEERSKAIEGYEDFHVKKPLWDAEKRLEKKKLEAIQNFTDGVAAYSTALGYDRDNDAAKHALASLYFSRWEEMEKEENRTQMAMIEGLIASLDTEGDFRDRIRGNGLLRVTTTPPGAEMHMFQYIEGPDRRLIPAPLGRKGKAWVIDPAFNVEATLGKPVETILKPSPSCRLGMTGEPFPPDPGEPRLPNGSYLL